MQALSMDESRLLPKGRAVYQRMAAFGAPALHAKVGLIFIALAIATRVDAVFALFSGIKARKNAGPRTGRMRRLIALAIVTNGLHAGEADGEKRGNAADLGFAASNAIWISCLDARA
ncbi:hypothetical protein [Xanthomonas arboricola]|nr:hypothetical protein [Xanthomonas arboricola]